MRCAASSGLRHLLALRAERGHHRRLLLLLLIDRCHLLPVPNPCDRRPDAFERIAQRNADINHVDSARIKRRFPTFP